MARGAAPCETAGPDNTGFYALQSPQLVSYRVRAGNAGIETFPGSGTGGAGWNHHWSTLWAQGCCPGVLRRLDFACHTDHRLGYSWDWYTSGCVLESSQASGSGRLADGDLRVCTGKRFPWPPSAAASPST